MVHPFDDREVVREELRALAMIPLTLAEIAEVVDGAGGRRPVGHGRPGRPSSTAANPRHGGLFVAIAGERVDGHEFAAAAVAAGAAAVLGPRPTPAPDRRRRRRRGGLARLARHVRRPVRPTVLALTGSQGKTGTKDYLAQVLAGVGQHGGHRRQPQQRARRPAHRAARTRRHRVPRRRDGRPRRRAHRLALPDRPARRGRRAQRRHRPPRRVRLARGHRAGQGRDRRGAAGRRHGRAQRRRPAGRRDGGPHHRAGPHLRRPRRRHAGATSSSTTSVGRRSSSATPASGTRSRCTRVGAHQVANAAAAAAMAVAVGVDLGRLRRAR